VKLQLAAFIYKGFLPIVFILCMSAIYLINAAYFRCCEVTCKLIWSSTDAEMPPMCN